MGRAAGVRGAGIALLCSDVNCVVQRRRQRHDFSVGFGSEGLSADLTRNN